MTITSHNIDIDKVNNKSTNNLNDHENHDNDIVEAAELAAFYNLTAAL